MKISLKEKIKVTKRFLLNKPLPVKVCFFVFIISFVCSSMGIFYIETKIAHFNPDKVIVRLSSSETIKRQINTNSTHVWFRLNISNENSIDIYITEIIYFEGNYETSLINGFTINIRTHKNIIINCYFLNLYHYNGTNPRIRLSITDNYGKSAYYEYPLL